MPTFLYRKLVRDNIWQWHIEAGHTPKGEQLSGDKLHEAMAMKLHEEADEVASAQTRDEFIEEIADVQQLIDDLCTSAEINPNEMSLVREEKRSKKGGFLEGHFIDTVTIPDENDKWAKYCRLDPKKYPEIHDATGHVDPVLPDIERGTYLHVKSGHHYDVIGITFHTETNEPLVLYKPLYESTYEIFARPYDMFMQTIEIDGKKRHRFEKILDTREA